MTFDERSDGRAEPAIQAPATRLPRNKPANRHLAISPQRTLPLPTVLGLLDKLMARPTDVGFAHWFLFKHRDNLRYIHELRCWALWDGRRWMFDAANSIMERAKDSVQTIIDLVPTESDHERRERILRLGNRLDSVARMRAMLDAAKTDRRVLSSVQDFDEDPWLLNVANGTIDLRDGRLLAHQREHMQSKIIEIQYDPSAAAPTWNLFLARIFRRHPEVIPFLQRAVGYTFTGSVEEHKFMLLHGSGRNGKSTFVETVRKTGGDYAQASVAETWLRQQGGRGPEPEIARLPGVRMVSTAEIGEGRALDEARVKGIVSGDAISTRQLYQNTFDFSPRCKLWISTNHAPQIRGNDEGMWRRVCLVPFAETINYEEMDRTLPAKLEAELPGILAWAVAGCLAWRSVGLAMPDIVLARTDDYRADQDIVGQFLDECCEIADDARVPAGLLYRGYVQWSKDRGDRHPFSSTSFGRRLSDRGIVGDKTGGKVYRRGVDLRPEARPRFDD